MKEITDYYTARALACGIAEDDVPAIFQAPVPLLSEGEHISFTASNKAVEDKALNNYKEVVKKVGTFALTCAAGDAETSVSLAHRPTVSHILKLLDPQPSKARHFPSARTGKVRNLALHALRPSDVPEGLLPKGITPNDEDLSLETGAALLALTGEHVTGMGNFQRAVGRVLLITAHHNDFHAFTSSNPEAGNQILRLRLPDTDIAPTA